MDAMNQFSSPVLPFVVAVGLLLAGCDSTGSSPENGTLQLTMSGSSTSKALQSSSKRPDNPTAADVDTALVSIEKISIVPSEDSSQSGDADVGVTALTDSNFTVDLKDLQSGIDAVLPTIDIPTGSYSQLRLVTADEAKVSFTDTNGTEDVMIASGQESGLKVNFPDSEFTVENADDNVELIVNWDVEEALKGAPQGNYVITPAINDVTVTVTSAGN